MNEETLIHSLMPWLESLDLSHDYPGGNFYDVDRIAHAICDFYSLERDALNLPTRKREIIEPRQIAHFMSLASTGKSLNYIGMRIGGKDHTTVIHSAKTVSCLYETDRSYRDKINQIQIRLGIDEESIHRAFEKYAMS